ncbi:DUF928 domain-containing protein [Laspinema olomoucense]|uniref:DUF928 domain-containing protein n=1 Tax=Laspinema olomoucense D3b TaxID=2953688 RepID=A0ABT2N3B4_9CYAN|nr:DUF928 domain-containing protein [Laspinema sp. D3b]MCT7970937.1 DUF928 domain-containing protein [Laspinema sp. D3d]MCT7976245.1 DUF928 domain-containing protein [Laspinema sp. D3b]
MLQTPLCRMIGVTYLVSFLILGASQLATPAIATESRGWIFPQRVTQSPPEAEMNSCNPEAIATDTSFRALLPPNQNQISTLKGLPSFFFYLPETSAQNAEFILSNESDLVLYKLRFALSGNPGIIRLQLPLFINLEPLEIQKIYSWSFSIICNPAFVSQNLTLSGTVQRLPLSGNLATQLQTAFPSSHPQIYAEAGLWMDAFSSLADLSQLPLDDPSNQEEWETLLQLMGLEALDALESGGRPPIEIGETANRDRQSRPPIETANRDRQAR